MEADMKSKKIFLTEENLILALKNQDIIAIQALIDMYSDSLGGTITKILNDPESSKDALQEIFCKIWNSAKSYEPSKGRLFTWMLNIARNYTKDILRSKRYRNSKKNICITDCQTKIDVRYKTTYNTDTVLIKQLVYELKPELNILLEMVYFKGYTHLEIADELNLPIGTVKTRIRTAIMKLRTQFD